MNAPLQLPEFNSIPAIREKLIQSGINKSFREGDVILDYQMRIRAIPIVTKGSVRVIQRDEEGRELLLYYIQAGESCIMSFLGGIHNDTSKVIAIAEEDTEISFLSIDVVLSMIRDTPEWLEYIFRLYQKRFEELLDVVNAVAFKRMDERLLAFLRKKSGLSNSKTLHLTHEQLAHELGTARVVVSRLLKRMESEGIVRLSRNNISLV